MTRVRNHSGDVTEMVEIEHFDRIAPVQPGKETEMEKKFGIFNTVEELNRAAAAQKAEGDLEALIGLATENGGKRTGERGCRGLHGQRRCRGYSVQ